MTGVTTLPTTTGAKLPAASPVVVAVDDTAHGLAAVRWAALEARLRSVTLTVVRVEPVDAGGRRADAVRRWLSAIRATVRRFAPDLPPATLEQLTGDPAEELIRRSHGAAVLALGVDRSRPREDYGALGPVEDRVVGRATCPVVLVPQQSVTADPPRLVLGWDGDHPAAMVAAVTALAEADLHTAPVDIIGLAQRASSDPELTELLGGAAARFSSVPEVRFVASQHVDPAPEQVVAALLDGAQEALLLVLGCRRRVELSPVGSEAVLAQVMRTAPCPVMVVGELVPPAGLRAAV